MALPLVVAPPPRPVTIWYACSISATVNIPPACARSTNGASRSCSAQIARLPGWSTAAVHVLHSRWAKEGDAIFDMRGPGGRRHQHLNPEQGRTAHGTVNSRLDGPESGRVASFVRRECTTATDP